MLPFAAIASPASIAADSSSTARLSFRIGQNNPDMTRLANRKAYNKIVRAIAARKAESDDVAVEITYYCAPGAENYINKSIGDARAMLLKDDLLQRMALPDSAFIITDGEAGWAELYCMIEATPSVNNRDEVLAIIKSDPSTRLHRLKKLNDGKAYAYLHENIFPLLRGNLKVTVGSAQAVAMARRIDGSINAVTVCADGSLLCTDCGCTPQQPASAPQQVVTYVVQSPSEAVDYGRFSFKTNLVYDFVLAPSLEVEYHFNPSWSLNLEYEMGWWKKKSKNKTYEIAMVSPEARWWFKSSTPGNGYYLGAFPGYAWFDFENGGTGHRGHGVFGGMSFGFVKPLTDKLSFEAGLGVGYLNLRYKDYEPVDDHHVYTRTKSTGYFGPLKVKLALVWHPWGQKLKKSASQR